MSAWYQVKRKLKRWTFALMPGNRVVEHGPRDGQKRIALTFDDGPCPKTVEYLQLLDELKVPATFFLQGDRADKYPELVGEYTKRGHQIASHGYNHHKFTELSVAELHDQLERTEAAIGLQPTPQQWVRPPYGMVSARTVLQIVGSGRVVAMWSFDSEDYTRKNPDDLVARCHPSAVQSGDVLLFHEEQKWTYDALPRIVDGLRAAGFVFVTMAELFV